jgi:hypothetical protein
MRALLDVNVWIALLDDAHVFSDRANGVVRILSSPAYSREFKLSPAEVAERLTLACKQLDHAFWPDDLSLRDAKRFDFTRLHGHRQITDAYLLALAVGHDGCLVTMDESVALGAVPGAARRHLRRI